MWGRADRLKGDVDVKNTCTVKTEGDRIGIYQAQGHGITMLLASAALLALAVLCLLFLILEGGMPSVLLALLGTASIFLLLIGGAGVGREAGLLWRRRPIIEMSAQGLCDNTSILSPGRIEWGEIAGFCLYRAYGAYYLGIDLRDAAGFKKRLPLPKRLAAALEVRRGRPPVNIHPFTGFDLAKLLVTYTTERGILTLRPRPQEKGLYLEVMGPQDTAE